MQNPGLIHLAEKICDNLDDEDLVKMYGVSKTCQKFIDVNYGRKRLIQKLDTILARKDYYPPESEDNGDYGDNGDFLGMPLIKMQKCFNELLEMPIIKPRKCSLMTRKKKYPKIIFLVLSLREECTSFSKLSFPHL